MDGIKREGSEKACKKIRKVRARMVAVRMVRVFNMSVEGAAALQVCCLTWIREWLRHCDEGCPGSPYAVDPEEFRETSCAA